MKRSGTNIPTRLIGWLLIGLLGLLVSGCASRPGATAPAGGATNATMSGPALGPAARSPAGHASVIVASDPEGAVVVVDGRPLGPAPQEVALPVNGNGFMSRPVSVKVRFVADDATGVSRTAEVMLTPLDRAPVRLDFTPQGARRTLASLKDG